MRWKYVHDIPAERNLKSGPLHPCAGVDDIFYSIKELRILHSLCSFPTLGNSLPSPVFSPIIEMGNVIEDVERGEEMSRLSADSWRIK